MPSGLDWFEAVARTAHRFTERELVREAELHPFDRRDISPALPSKVRRLFDDGHYAEATFEAFKFVDKSVRRHSGLKESGFKLMMAAFDEGRPAIQLTPLVDLSDIDEQKGYRFLFAGSVLAIRNPRGHEVELVDDIDTALDHLGLASLLIRRLEEAGYA